MTIEEKRERIENHCEQMGDEICDMCKLSRYIDVYSENCYSGSADIERNYNILFGSEDAENTAIPARADKPDNVLKHQHICTELNELYARKNADYGDSFHKTYLEEGMAMSRIRLTDKLERFKRLSKSEEQNVKDENIRDTLIDLANYAIMTVMEIDGEN